MPEEKARFVRGRTRVSQRSLRMYSGVQRVDAKAKRRRTKDIRQKLQAGLEAQEVDESQEVVPLEDVDFVDTSNVVVVITDAEPITQTTSQLSFIEGLVRSGVDSGMIDPPSKEHIKSLCPFFNLFETKFKDSSHLPVALPQYIPPSLLLLPTTLLPRGLVLVVCSSHRRARDVLQSFRPRNWGVALMLDTLELANFHALDSRAREACLSSCGGRLELLQKLFWKRPYGALQALVGTGAVRYLVVSERRACLPCFRTFLEKVEVPRVLLVLDSLEPGLANLCITHLSSLFTTVLREPRQRLWVTDLPCTHIPFNMVELASILQTHDREKHECRAMVLGNCIVAGSDIIIRPPEIEELEAYPRFHPSPTSQRRIAAFRDRFRTYTTEDNRSTSPLIVLEPSLDLEPLLAGLGTMPRVCTMYSLKTCVARYNTMMAATLLQGRYLVHLVDVLKNTDSTILDCTEIWETCLTAFGLHDFPLHYHTLEAALKVVGLQPLNIFPAAYTIKVYGALPFDVHAAKYPVLQGIPFVTTIKEPQRFTVRTLATHSGTSAATVIRLLSEIHEEEPRLVFNPVPDVELIEVIQIDSQGRSGLPICLDTIAKEAARLGMQFLYDIRAYSETLSQAFHALCSSELSMTSPPNGDVLMSSIKHSLEAGIPLCSTYRAAGGSEDWILAGLITSI